MGMRQAYRPVAYGGAVRLQDITSRAEQALPAPARSLMDVIKESRLMGLSAEAAFWITFTLPWIALGALSSIGFITRNLDPATLDQIRKTVLDAAAKVLTPQAVNSFLEPLLTQVTAGRTDLTLVGIIVALWSGSRLVGSLTQGVSVINGAPFRLGYARNRAFALLIYVVGLVGLAVVVAVMVVGPDRLSALFGFSLSVEIVLSYLLVSALAVGLIVLLYQIAAPTRAPLSWDLIGAVIAVVGWVLGSLGLHYYTDRLFTELSVYSAVAAPIAILLWSYVSAIAVFVGAASVAARRSHAASAAESEAATSSAAATSTGSDATATAPVQASASDS